MKKIISVVFTLVLLAVSVFGLNTKSVNAQSASTTVTCIDGFVFDSAGKCVATNPNYVLKVLAPNDGGSLAQGQTYRIKWSGGREKVDVWLLDDTTRLGKVIFSGIANNNYVDWTVAPLTSADLYNGKNGTYTSSSGKYVIFVNCTNTNCTVDDSDRPFTIIPSTQVNPVFVCPVGYTCTPIQQPVGCPAGYTCVPTSGSTPTSNQISLLTQYVGLSNQSYQVNLSFVGGTASQPVSNWKLYIPCPRNQISVITVPGDACGAFEMGSTQNYGNIANKDFYFKNTSGVDQTLNLRLVGYDNANRVLGTAQAAIKIPPTATGPMSWSQVTVLSPNGGQTFNAGSQLLVTWNTKSGTFNLAPSSRTEIYILKDRSVVADYDNLANDGSESITIPSTLKSGTDYKVTVTVWSTSPVGGQSDESDAPFTIIASTATAVDTTNSGYNCKSDQVRHEAVRQLYLKLQKREPDQAGWDYWTCSTLPLDQMEQSMKNSQEYTGKQNIISLSQNIIGRSPTDAELNPWYLMVYNTTTGVLDYSSLTTMLNQMKSSKGTVTNTVSPVVVTPYISSVYPDSGKKDDVVRIYGKNFDGLTQDTIFLSTSAGSINPQIIPGTLTSTQFSIRIPNIPYGTYDLYLWANAGESNHKAFKVTSAAVINTSSVIDWLTSIFK